MILLFHVMDHLGLHSIRPENAVRKLKAKKYRLAKTTEDISLKDGQKLVRSTKQREMRINQKMRGANAGNEMEASGGARSDYNSETMRPYSWSRNIQRHG